MKEFKLWQNLTSLITANQPLSEETEPDFWRYAEPAGKEPDPLKRNVLQWRRLLLSTKDAVSVFADQPVNVIGFVDRPSESAENLFQLVRPIIRCCLDDTVTLGLPVLASEANSFELNTWLRIYGSFVPFTVGQRQILVIKPERIQKILKPEKTYINGVF